MNILLSACDRKKDVNLFLMNLGLLTIWPEDQTEQVVDSYEQWLHDPKESGKFYKIISDGCVIGITGYWLIDETTAGLRWHGIIPLFRNSGAGSLALQMLIELLPENVTQLHEITFTRKPQQFFCKNNFKINTNPDDIVKVIKSCGGDGHFSVLTYEVEKCNDTMGIY